MSTDHPNGKVNGNGARAEQALRASEMSYRRLFEAAQDGILILDVNEGRVTDVNPFLVKLLGFSRDEMVGKTVGELSPFKDIVSNQAMLERLQQHGYVRYDELPLETKDGRKIGVEFVSNVYQAGDKQVIQCNIRDMTERKKVEEAMRASEARFSTVFRVSPLSIAISRLKDGAFVDVNGAWEKAMGFTREEVIGRKGVELNLWPDATQRERLVINMRESAAIQGFEVQIRRKSGAIRDMLISAEQFDFAGEPCMLTTAMDITERKLAKTALTRLAAIVEFSDDAIIGKDLDGIIQSWNTGAEKIFGYSSGEMVGGPMTPLIPADRQDEENHILEKIRRGESVLHFVTVRHTKDGRLIDVSVTVSPIKDSTGKIVGVSKVARDITERKQMVKALRESEEQFHAIFDLASVGIAQADPRTGQWLRVNRKMCEITGYSANELLQLHVLDITHPEDRQSDREAFERVVRGESPDYRMEKRYIRKDGALIWVNVNMTVIRDAAGQPTRTVAAIEDITGRRKFEEDFRQTQKMETIGQLAGGVAHDFNNILGVIQMQSDLLKTEDGVTPAQLENAGEIGKAAQRAASLTRQLLLFSRKQTLQMRDLDLDQSISEMGKMLRRTLGEDIQLEFRFAMQPLFIHADPGMMDQVLMNLAVNARDAMPKGGRLVIETSTVEFDESIRGQSAHARPGSFVCLSVSDTGCGIPAENLPRIFEPFFTTKDVGKGTGLGLATVFGIVQQHQGWIHVYSEAGHGTTFRIYLPRLAKMTGQQPEQSILTSMRGGSETILLVEDDALLRAAVRKALSQLGYRVLEAINGVEALDVWKQHREEIHLLLTDLVMPGGITGKELAGRFLKENPKLKVIYTSGYSAEVAGKGFPLEEGVNFLTKPYQSFMLAQTVRQNLDATSSLHDRNGCAQAAVPDEPLTLPATPSARTSSGAESSVQLNIV